MKREVKHKKQIALVLALIYILFFALVCWFVGKPMVSLATKPDVFREWIDSKGILGSVVFVAMLVFQIIFALIPGEPLEIGAGYAFGAIEGTILCVIGSFIGSVIVLYFVRKFGYRFIEIFYPIDKINNLKFLKNSNRRDIIIFVLFLLPGTPKDILTYFIGITKIKPSTFIVATTIARLPSIVTSTIGGNAIGNKNYLFAFIVFVVTLFISIIGIIVYQMICKYNLKKHL